MRKKKSAQIHLDMCENRSKSLNFIILDKYSFCRAAVENQAIKPR